MAHTVIQRHKEGNINEKYRRQIGMEKDTVTMLIMFQFTSFHPWSKKNWDIDPGTVVNLSWVVWGKINTVLQSVAKLKGH